MSALAPPHVRQCALNDLAEEAMRCVETGEQPRAITAKRVYGAVVDHLENFPLYQPEMDARLALLRDAIRHMASFSRPVRWCPPPDMVELVKFSLGKNENIDGD